MTYEIFMNVNPCRNGEKKAWFFFSHTFFKSKLFWSRSCLLSSDLYAFSSSSMAIWIRISSTSSCFFIDSSSKLPLSLSSISAVTSECSTFPALSRQMVEVGLWWLVDEVGEFLLAFGECVSVACGILSFNPMRSHIAMSKIKPVRMGLYMKKILFS